MLLKFRKEIAVSLILLLLVCSLNFTVNAQYGKVGVRPGDWMVHYLLYQGKNYPTPYPQILYRTILSVNDAWVELNYTAFWTNGTIEKKVVGGNVSKGAEGISPILIPPNLNVGDRILLKITENFELDITIEEEKRAEVNLNGQTVERTLISARFSFGQPPWPLVNVTASWDKVTGILVFMLSQHETFNSTCSLRNTNAFITNNNEKPLQLNYQLVVAIATIIILIVLTTYAIFKLPKKEKRR